MVSSCCWKARSSNKVMQWHMMGDLSNERKVAPTHFKLKIHIW